MKLQRTNYNVNDSVHLRATQSFGRNFLFLFVLNGKFMKDPGQVFLEAFVIGRNGGILQDIKGGKRRTRNLFHAKETIVGVKGEPKVVDGFTLKQEFFLSVKGSLGSVKGKRQHVRFARERTTGTVAIFGRGTTTTVTVAQAATHAWRPHLVGPFLGFPSEAHPIGGRLIKDQIGPLVLGNFVVGIVVVGVGNVGAFDFTTTGLKELFRQGTKGLVELAFGKATKRLAPTVFVGATMVVFW